MPIVLEQINPAECSYTFRGKNIAYQGQRNMRELAKLVGVRSDGSRFEVFRRIVSYLNEIGAKAEISETAEATDIKVTPEPVEPTRPAKKVARKRGRPRKRKATFLEQISPERKATFL